MNTPLSTGRRRWRDAFRAATALSAVMLGISVVTAMSAQALPANTPPTPGQVVSVTSGKASATPATDTKWALSLTSPDNKCPGDGLAGFKWSTYMVPSAVDVATLTYNNAGPVAPTGVSVAYPLYSAVGSSPQINKNPGIGDGLVTGTPAEYSFSALVGLTPPLPNGTYKIGYACHKDGQTERFWQREITITNSTATGFDFTVSAAPTTTTTVAGSTTTTVAGSTTTTVAGSTTTTIKPTTTTGSTTTTIAGAAGPSTTIGVVTLPNFFPTTGSSSAGVIAFWAVMVLVLGRITILLARPVRVVTDRRR